MNPWYAKALILAGSVAMIIIRAPHGHRSRKLKVAKSRKGPLEVILLTLAWLGFFIPLVWVSSPAFAAAEIPLHPLLLVGGTVFYVLGLWLFHRSHVDLGGNWSITLELREGHHLVTQGVYHRVRHPMYLSLLLYSIGQALAVPNWIAGPSYLVVMALLIVFRLAPEERMMREEFGKPYEEYAARTKRLLPFVW